MDDKPSTSDEGSHCYHCGLDVPQGSHYQVIIDGQPRAMCCPGCEAVAEAIVNAGLVDYYRYRTDEARNASDLVPEALKQLELYDQPALQKSFVTTAEDDVREASLILEGITCAACIWLNERHVSALDGVLEFQINYSTKRARLRWDDSRIHLSEILKSIAAIGYVAHPFDPGRQEAVHKKERKQALRRLAVAALGMVQVMMLSVALYAGDAHGIDSDLQHFLRWMALVIASPVVLYSAQPFFRSGWRDLRHRQLGMDVPVSLAIGAAFIASCWATVSQSGEVYFDSVTMFTLFLLLSRFLEMGARQRAGRVAEELVKLLPAMAIRLMGDGEEVVAVGDLAPGDRLRIKPGESVPADGCIESGRTHLDESLLTGESLPVAKTLGDSVIGGSVNIDSPIIMRVEKVGADTVLSAIQRLLDRAQTEKPSLARLADRVASVFVAVILLLAVVVAAYWWQHAPEEAFWITLSVLVVTCPCALSLATPVALTAATSHLTQKGVLTTRGHALETLSQVSHVIFDKTGTLTQGQLQLESVESYGELSDQACIDIAAAIERQSEHPVARALVAAAVREEGAEAVVSTPGEGIVGRVGGQEFRIGNAGFSLVEVNENTPGAVYLAGEQGLLASFHFADQLRQDAAECVQQLRQMGMAVTLLSGDHPHIVSEVADALQIEHAHGGMLPQDKLRHIQQLQSQGEVVLMVGDGINDAPVLAAAQISMAMGNGTQLAQASADMILLSERLTLLADAVIMARRTRRIIRQNLAWAVGYNIMALPMAATGLIAPWMAAIGMSLSSLVVVVNALRLGRQE